MTDLTPAQAEAVRRALADARHTGPVPPEVADRLAATLEDLVAEREAPMVAAALARPGAEPDTGPGSAVDSAPATAPAAESSPAAPSDRTSNVVPLWRRRLPAVLAAAAAVTAFAVVAPQLLGSDDSGEPASTLAEDARDSAPPPESAGALSATPPAPLSADDSTLYGTDQESRAKLDAPVLRLHDATIEQELAFLLRPTAASAHGSGPWVNSYDADELNRDMVANAIIGCGPEQLAEGSTVYAARYHRHPALAVVLPATDDGVPVEIYDCAAADPRVPARTVVLEASQ